MKNKISFVSLAFFLLLSLVQNIGAQEFLLPTSLGQYPDEVYRQDMNLFDELYDRLPEEQEPFRPLALDHREERFPGATGPVIDEFWLLMVAAQEEQWEEVAQFSIPGFIDTADKAKQFFTILGEAAGVGETHLSENPPGVVARVFAKDGQSWIYSLFWTYDSIPKLTGAFLGGPETAHRDILEAQTQAILTDFLRINNKDFDRSWWKVPEPEDLLELTQALPHPLGGPRIFTAPGIQAPLMDISPFVARILRDHNEISSQTIPGAAISVLTPDGNVYVGFSGLRRQDRLDSPIESMEEGWHLGSNTKSMSATLYATEVVAKGLGGFDSTLGEIFLDYPGLIGSAYEGVSIGQIMQHRGGFPFMPPEELARQDPIAATAMEPNPNMRPQNMREAVFQGYFSRFEPPYPPGASYLYSNLGYVLIGHAVEVLVSRAESRDWSFEELLQDRLFTAIGIDQSWMGPPGESGVLSDPRGHSDDGRAWEPPFDNPPYMTPAGRVSLSVLDHLRYGYFHLRAREGGFAQILPGGVAKRQQELSSISHDGSNTLWYSRIILDHGKQRVIVMETNSPHGSQILRSFERLLVALP